jgi:2-methylcitrate dehydratase PrpD
MTSDPTSKLADFVLGLEPAILPPECLEAAKRCFVDYFAVTLAGSQEPIARALRGYLGGESGASTVVGNFSKTSLENAAFANGTLGHALDYDDVKSNIGHASVVIAPALLALGELRGSTGAEILTCFVAGFEMSCRVANSVESRHSQQGWHTTSTCGVFGAAAACGKLLALHKDALVGAFGMAASFSSGLRRNMGTLAKPIHVGQAAQSGLKAALLASRGIYGDRKIFSDEQSYGDVFSSPHDEEALVSNLAKSYEILANGFKLYPCCASAHAAIDAVLQLRKEHQIDPEKVEAVRVGTVPLGLDNLVYSRPRDTTQCRFSMPFCVALALIDGWITVENFSGNRLADERMKRLMQKVTMYRDPDMAPLGYRGTGNANVTLTTKDGQIFKRWVDAARGRASNPVSNDELWTKFRACAGPALSEIKSEKLLSLLISFEELPNVRELLALASGPHLF